MKDAIPIVSDVANKIREKAKDTEKENPKPSYSPSNTRPSDDLGTNSKSSVTAAQDIAPKSDKRFTDYEGGVTEHPKKSRRDYSFFFAKLLFGGVAVMFLSLLFVPGPAGVLLAGLAAFVGVVSVVYLLIGS